MQVGSGGGLGAGSHRGSYSVTQSATVGGKACRAMGLVPVSSALGGVLSTALEVGGGEFGMTKNSSRGSESFNRTEAHSNKKVRRPLAAKTSGK